MSEAMQRNKTILLPLLGIISFFIPSNIFAYELTNYNVGYDNHIITINSNTDLIFHWNVHYDATSLLEGPVYVQNEFYFQPDFSVHFCTPPRGPISDGNSLGVTDEDVNITGYTTLGYWNLITSESNSVDGNGCMTPIYDSHVAINPVYDEAGEPWQIGIMAGSGSNSTTTIFASSTDAEALNATTGVASLGFASFVVGFISILWMYKYFLA